MVRTWMVAIAFAAMAMFAVVSAAPQTPKADPKTKAEPPKPVGKFSLKSKAADIRIGTHNSGPMVKPEDLKGRVVFLDYWGIECPPCLKSMPAIAALNAELSDYGLVVLGSHVQEGTPEQIRVAALQRGVNFHISQQTRAQDDGDLEGIPHCFVFDHTGLCIYRGLPGPADAQIRLAVGNAIVSGTGKDKFSPAVQAVVKELKAGKSPATLLAKVVALKSAGGETATEAKALLESMTAVGQKKLKEAEELQGKDALAAFLLVEKLPTTYKGTPLATKSTEMIGKLKKEKVVLAELAARPALTALKKLELPLVGTADGSRMPEYQKANATVLKQMKAKVAEMKKAWPDSHATKEALEIAQRYAIELN